MKTPAPNRTGILLVRLWIDGEPREGFRARITQTLDVAGAEKAAAFVATPDALYGVIRTWVETFASTN